METAYLATFVQILDGGSMSEAARRLDLTPAAVAQQVRVLQKTLGTPLLTRVGRTVVPTAAGLRLAEQARRLVRDIEQLRLRVNDELAESELRLGAINTALHGMLPDVLGGFVKVLPMVRVHVRSALSQELHDAVRTDEIDVAICQRPAFALPKTMHWELLRKEALILLTPQRWARREPHRLLAEVPFIRYDRSLAGGKEAERYLGRAGITPIERFELSSLAAIALLVDRGLGVSLTPDSAAPGWAGLRIARLPLPMASDPRQFGMLWQRANPRQRLIQELAKQARRVAQEGADQ